MLYIVCFRFVFFHELRKRWCALQKAKPFSKGDAQTRGRRQTAQRSLRKTEKNSWPENKFPNDVNLNHPQTTCNEIKIDWPNPRTVPSKTQISTSPFRTCFGNPVCQMWDLEFYLAGRDLFYLSFDGEIFNYPILNIYYYRSRRRMKQNPSAGQSCETETSLGF